MQLHFIHESRFGSLPDGIEEKLCFEPNEMITMEDSGHSIRGRNCIISGSAEAIIKWLKPYDSFLKGVGNPQLDNFKIVHVKKVTDEA